MPNAFDEIVQWSNQLPYWEQAALQIVMAGRIPDDAEYEQLLQFLLEEEDLAEKRNPRPALNFAITTSRDEAQLTPIILREISELQNVNALVPNQRLTFCPRLTAIYGLNGSGKSGYARVLGSAGFTRGDRDILPDVTMPFDESIPTRATIKVDIAGAEKSFVHEIGLPCSELSSFYVFDSTSVHVHIKGKNTFSFTPAGLSVLTTLARVTDEVRDRLATRIAALETPGDLHQYFLGTSDIRDLVETLSADTDLEQLRALSHLRPDEELRIHELEVQIGNIGLGRHHQEIEQKTHDLDLLQTLHKWLVESQSRLQPKAIQEVNALLARFQALSVQSRQLGVDRFQHRGLSQVGTEVWDNFIKSAHSLALAESNAARTYPQEADVCLLCQQPLSQDAQELLHRMWAYLTAETQEEITRIEEELTRTMETIEGDGTYSLLQDLTPSLALLATLHPELRKRTEVLARTYLQRGQVLIEAIHSRGRTELGNWPSDDCSDDILRLIDQVALDLVRLEELNLDLHAQDLEAERQSIEHRKQLKSLMPQIEDHVKQRHWAREAAGAGGSTRHITQQYNVLFDHLVASRYIEIFSDILSSMGRPLLVDIVTSGRKGETVKQIQLRAHATAEDIADADKVLSEGEKRAIALADFLTEAALDASSNGIVLDDPVTSLDLEWRTRIAELLADEAAKRQVVVFTHDLAFLYFLLTYAEDKGIEKSVHWIQRGETDGRPGYVRLDNCPTLEQEYKSSEPSRRIYQIAREATGAEQETLIREGMAALRTSYEALVVFELFGGVVQRFQERIQILALPSLVWDDQILQEIADAFTRLSRYMEGHLHSDSLAEPLKPSMLMQEITGFDELKQRIRALKKAKGAN